MYVSLVVWDLTESDATVESLRHYLSDYAVDAYSTLEGMRLKAWFSNPDKQIWGAIYLWDALGNMDGPSKVSRAIELIGYPPTSSGIFELEATAEGHSAYAVLSGLGNALAGKRGAGGQAPPAAQEVARRAP
ncbi:hypothetical protein [Nonomuraea diastatica]|uniref:YdhR family protein n=1 Tax=Nonomuraea diastatica TaxID=1848329 RepID=A0A4R4WAJ2_9ACTN|nr:hypothetical protein [Nonomuraea diastatica]TDD12904.1 hypothetical protein E1294_43000 [Nonomuraea diastatica]